MWQRRVEVRMRKVNNCFSMENDSDSSYEPSSNTQTSSHSISRKLTRSVTKQLEKEKMALDEQRVAYERGVEWNKQYENSLASEPTHSEKLQLTYDLPKLSNTQLQTVKKIIAEEAGHTGILDTDVFEIPVKSLSTSTIRRLQHFVRDYRGYYTSLQLDSIEKRMNQLKEKSEKEGDENQAVRKKQYQESEISSDSEGCSEQDMETEKEEELRSGQVDDSSNTGGIFDGLQDFQLSAKLRTKLTANSVDVETLMGRIMKEAKTFRDKRYNAVQSRQKSRLRKHKEGLNVIRKRRIERTFRTQLKYVEDTAISRSLLRTIEWLVPHRAGAEIICVECEKFAAIRTEKYDHFTPSRDFRVFFSRTTEPNKIMRRLNSEMRALLKQKVGDNVEDWEQTRKDALRWLIGIDARKWKAICRGCSKRRSGKQKEQSEKKMDSDEKSS